MDNNINWNLLQSQNPQQTRTINVPSGNSGDSGLNALGSLIGGFSGQGNSQAPGQVQNASNSSNGGISGLLRGAFGDSTVHKANQAINQSLNGNPNPLGNKLLGLNDQQMSLDQLKQQQNQRLQQNQLLQNPNATLKLASNNPINITTGLSPLTSNVIKHFEGFTGKPEWDVNAYRAGYGSDTTTTADGKVMKIQPGMHINEEDAERDLQRRGVEFQTHAASQIGQAEWSKLPPNAQAALTSVAYNYGSLPKSVAKAAQSGDVNKIADAVERLAHDNQGINRSRRMKEADLIRTGSIDW